VKHGWRDKRRLGLSDAMHLVGVHCTCYFWHKRLIWYSIVGMAMGRYSID